MRTLPAILIFLFATTAFPQHVVKDWDVTRKGYYRVVVQGDTLGEKFTRYDTALKFAYDYAGDSAQGADIKIIPPSYEFDYSYAETVYDTTDVQQTALEGVSTSYYRDDSTCYMYHKGLSTADSVRFTYWIVGDAAPLRDTVKTPNNGVVRDTIRDPPIDSIGTRIIAWYKYWRVTRSVVTPLAMIDTLGDSQIEATKKDTMSQYFTDFSEYTTGQAPSDWTSRWQNDSLSVESEASATGGQVLSWQSGDNNDHSLTSWDDIDGDANRDDVEIVAKMREHGATNWLGLLARASGGFASRDTYMGNFRLGSSNDLLAEKWVGGSYSLIHQETGYSFAQDTWYWCRLRINGSTIRMRVWEDGTSEPSTWDVDETDSSLSAAGWVGIGSYQDINADIDVFGVGTNGDPAPTSADGGTALQGNDINHSQSLEQGGIGTLTMPGGDLSHSHSLEQGTVPISLNGGGLSHSHSLGQSSIQTIVLSGNEVSQSQSLEQGALPITLNGNSLSHSHSLEQADLGIVLTGQDLSHSHSLDQADLARIQLIANSLSHTHSLQQGSFVGTVVLSANDLTHSHNLGQGGLVTFTLPAEDLSQAHSLEDGKVLIVLDGQGLSHSHTIQQADLQTIILSGDDLSHSQTLGQGSLIVVGEATKVSLEAKELYTIRLEAQKLYKIELSEKELHQITLNANEIIE